MKRLFLALAASLAAISCAESATYTDNGGTIIEGVAVIPFPFQPLCPESHGVSLAAATTLAGASMLPTGIANAGRTCITQTVTPRYCVATAQTATVYYTLDGSTTAASGKSQLQVGASIVLSGALQINAAQFYSATGTLDVECSQ